MQTDQFQQICLSEPTWIHHNKGLTSRGFQNHQVYHSSCEVSPRAVSTAGWDFEAQCQP